MEFLSCLLFQLDEARRYVGDGRLQHLRLAFLLLDNAVEIQMDHCIKQDLERDEFMAKLRQQAQTLATQVPVPPELRELIGWIPLTPSEKIKLDRYFDEKVAYMVGRGGHVDVSFAGPLKYLHRYRNEAYHRARIRHATIRTSALILLEINCQMLLTLPRDSSWSSTDHNSWLKERFQVDPFPFDLQLQSMVDEIRSGLLPNDEAVACTMADHLQDRFSKFDDSLDFIVKADDGFKDKEAALTYCQYYRESRRTSGHALPQTPKTFVPQCTMNSVQALKNRLPELRSASNRLGAFDLFASIESGFEPSEQCVDELVRQIEGAIQLAVDVSLGK
jgi:hypothetical protein